MGKELVPSPKYAISKATRVVSYLTPEEVYQIADAARRGRNGERDYLLILTLFQTGLRISEALSLTPRRLGQYDGKPCLSIVGKGKKPRSVACPEALADKMRSYAYQRHLDLDDRFFAINRCRAWGIIKQAGLKAGIYNKKVYPHIFRHSDAIYRLRVTGNPRALQHHLGHESPMMTMRYLSTLQQEDSLRIQQQVEFE